jgi:hypothetical protein
MESCAARRDFIEGCSPKYFEGCYANYLANRQGCRDTDPHACERDLKRLCDLMDYACPSVQRMTADCKN